jgi:hypothetical protein
VTVMFVSPYFPLNFKKETLYHAFDEIAKNDVYTRLKLSAIVMLQWYHNPECVFVLLQTLYQGFNLFAERRNVFKVETIQTCSHCTCYKILTFNFTCYLMHVNGYRINRSLDYDCSGLRITIARPKACSKHG